MRFLDSILDKARAQRQTIVLAEGEDARVITAARSAHDDGIANCILVGSEAAIRQQAQASGHDLTDIRIEDPSASQYHQRYSENLWQLRKHKGLTREQAEQQARDPLCFADLMLQAGDADGAIAGAVYTTGDRVRSALQIVGVLPGFSSVSSFMLMLFETDFHEPKRAMIFADCGLIIDPDPEQLAEITVAAVDSARHFIDEEPRVAMLSFSTDGSADHPHVDKVREATRLARGKLPDIAIEGEVQLDAAIVPEIAAKKISDSKINGLANVLIFPDLDAGNIGYKLTQRFGGATVIGPILQGLKRPANDLSRGCDIKDIYYLIAVSAVQSQN
ncbi:MAG: phosphate acetyltransferase [Gammaproteobacteria bacterium]|nr:MAG: phosphate acetyltransferase [Gammaproteobacteria bacterium]UCH39641.1 MAG: phosphate acetyltransferase [Gammaproteobacteria bacterium]